MQVKVGNLSIRWQKGPGVRADEVELRLHPESEPFFYSKSLFVGAGALFPQPGRWFSLEITLKSPCLTILKKRNESINWTGLSQILRSGGAALLFSKVRIENAAFTILNDGSGFFRHRSVHDVDAELRQTYLGGPVHAQGTGRIFDEEVKDLAWSAVWRPVEQQVDLDVNFRDQALKAKLSLLPFQTPRRLIGSVIIDKLDLYKVNKGMPFDGTSSGTFDFESAGRDPNEFLKNLRGRGVVEIQNGKFKGMNFIALVLSRIQDLTGEDRMISNAAPAGFKVFWENPDTFFQYFQIQAIVEGGEVSVQSLLLKGEHYSIQAKGTLHPNGALDLSAQIVFQEEFSNYLKEKFPEMSSMVNSQQRIVIPFVARGNLRGEIHAQLDLAYFAERMGQPAEPVFSPQKFDPFSIDGNQNI